MTNPNKDKHTQGPWSVGGFHPQIGIIVCIDSGCGFPNPEPPIYDLLFELTDGKNITEKQREELLANAHLVAAAPTMLRALRAIRDKLQSSVVEGDWRKETLLLDRALEEARYKPTEECT